MKTIAKIQVKNESGIANTPDYDGDWPPINCRVVSHADGYDVYEIGADDDLYASYLASLPPQPLPPPYPQIGQDAAIALIASDKFIRIAVETQTPMSKDALEYRNALRKMLSGQVPGPLPTEPPA